jgi:hypothetical protein
MATTTTNFGWDIPQSTDLVKDGATAIAALGQDIDTALVDLKGGTTGQVLAKASGSDLDFSWVAQDDSNAIQNAIVDAKGDLIAATANDTPARLAVGTNGQVLVADSTAATGLKWQTASAGALTLINTTTFSSVASQSINSVFSSTYANYKIMLEISASSGTSLSMDLRLRASGTDASTDYKSMLATFEDNWTTGTTVSIGSTDRILIGYRHQTTGDSFSSIDISNPFATKNTQSLGFYNSTGTGGASSGNAGNVQGVLVNTTSYDGFTIFPNTGTFSGTVRIYGYGN